MMPFGGGQILPSSEDKKAPIIDPNQIEKNSFIPYDFALAKIKSAAAEYHELRCSYEEHVSRMKHNFELQSTHVKTFYENYIKELKAKTKSHIEHQKQVNEKLVSDLRSELDECRRTEDELRDLIADLRTESQRELKKVRDTLSAQVDENVRIAENLDHTTAKLECSLVLSGLISETGQRIYEQNASDFELRAISERDSLKSTVQKLVQESKSALDSLAHDFQVQRTMESECREVLNEVLSRVEIEESRSHAAALASKDAEINRRDAMSAQAILNVQELINEERRQHSEEMSFSREDFHVQLQKVMLVVNQHHQANEVEGVSLEQSSVIGELNGEGDKSADGALIGQASSECHDGGVAVVDIDVPSGESHPRVDTDAKTESAGVEAQELTFLNNRIASLEIELCLQVIIAEVVEKNTPSPSHAVTELLAAETAVAHEKLDAEPVIVAQGIHDDSHEPAISTLQVDQSAASVALLERVSQLESECERLKLELQERSVLAENVATVAAGEPPNDVTERKRQEYNEAKAALQDQLDSVERRIHEVTERVSSLSELKNSTRSFIEEWTRQFESEHEGRAPGRQDKEEIRDRFHEYKTASSDLKEASASLETLNQEKASLQQQLELLQNTDQKEYNLTVAGDGGGPVPVPVPVPVLLPTQLPAETQSQSREEDIRAIENLEDQVYQLQTDLAESQVANQKLIEENQFVSAQLEALVKEKRTDVVKRYEEEITALRAVEASLTESISVLKAEKTKNDAKIAELTGRAEIAERELKDRDSRELNALSPADERVVLKKEVGKQREEIINKAKGATAGWNAAASAEEKLEIDVAKAYRKGKEESEAQHKADMAALNESLEVKEKKITEMLVTTAEMERRVRDAEARTAEALEQVKQAQQEAVEAIAAFGAGGGGATDGGGAVSSTELDAVKDELDAAQEEIVVLAEKCDSLNSALQIAQQKMEIYEQLIIATEHSAKQRIEQVQAHATAALAGGGGLADLLITLRNAIDRGQKMWKNNQRNEVYDLYLKTCEDASQMLRTPALAAPLQESIVQGRAQGAQKKERGANILKKALDRLIADIQLPENRKAEEEAAQAVMTEESPEQGSSVTQELNAQLMILSKQEEAIREGIKSSEQSAEKAEGAPSAKEEAGPLEAGGEIVQSSTKGEGEGTGVPVEPQPQSQSESQASGSQSASLLRRAKAAEKKVELLKKQIAMMAQMQQAAADAAAVASDAATAVGGSTKEGAAVTTTAAPATRRGAAAATTVAGRPAASVGGANPAELRKLQRRVKELEDQIASSAAAGGLADKKAAMKVEKELNRKIKDLESGHRKEKISLEARAAKAEASLQAATSSLPQITAERDRLRSEVKKFANQEAELDRLRKSAAQFETLTEQFQALQKDRDVLADQYKKEYALRKKYKNDLEDLKGAIRVYARCRPMVGYERERGCKQAVEIYDDTKIKVRYGRGEKDFEFDTIFDESSTQDQVFEDTKRLVESCLDGYNVCLFAYGQTGSGKTFTMTGSQQDPGLTPKAITELFRLIEERRQCNIKVTCYFVELYNDNLVDLFWLLDNSHTKGGGAQDPPRLDIKLDGNKMVFIRNCVMKEVVSYDELMNLFNTGNAERHVGATRMNAESSRSHSIFSILIESYDTATKKTVRGKLSLVDLAGSERADKTGGTAERLKEGQSINKSLSALGDVMAALTEGEKFIPYRNNKLTQLMQDSLGGNAKTLMFVNFSPADYNADETVSSLNFATRVKKVVNKPSQLKESAEAKRLRAEIARLRALVGEGAGGAAGELEDADEAEEPEEAPAEAPPPVQASTKTSGKSTGASRSNKGN